MSSISNDETESSSNTFVYRGGIAGEPRGDAQAFSMLRQPQTKQSFMTAKPVSSKKRRLFSLFLIALSALFAWGLSNLWTEYLELGPQAFLNRFNPLTWQNSDGVDVHLSDDSIFVIKKKQKLFGMQVYRIISKQQPQEFLLITGVSSSLLNHVFDKPIDRFWVNQIAQQLLHLRIGTDPNTEDAAVPKEPGIEVRSVTPEPSRNVVFADESYPYWHLKLKLQLSTETLPRYYQVGILRSVLPQASRGNDKETILVTYTPENTIQVSTMLSLLKQIN